MNLDVPNQEIECPRCGFYAAEVIYQAHFDAEYLFCNCGVFKILSDEKPTNSL